MKITVLGIIAFVAICCGCGRQQKIDRNPPAEQYHQRITEYENHYNADGLLEKLVQHAFSIIEDSRMPHEERVYRYEYFQIAEAVTEKREYFIPSGSSPILISAKRTSPALSETIEFRRGDTVSYELTRRNKSGHIILEQKLSKLNYPELDMVVRSFDNVEYEYDDLGRQIKKTVQRCSADIEHKYESVFVYCGDTQEILSERYRNLSDGFVFLTEYRTSRSGDTLIQKAFCDDELMEIIKKTPNYNSSTLYTDGAPTSCNEEITAAGNILTKISYDYEDGATDTLRYENGLLTREVRIMSTTKTIDLYDYDTQGNVLMHHQQVWLYGER